VAVSTLAACSNAKFLIAFCREFYYWFWDCSC